MSTNQTTDTGENALHHDPDARACITPATNEAAQLRAENERLRTELAQVKAAAAPAQEAA
jgi:hypothetical protein